MVCELLRPAPTWMLVWNETSTIDSLLSSAVCIPLIALLLYRTYTPWVWYFDLFMYFDVYLCILFYTQTLCIFYRVYTIIHVHRRLCIVEYVKYSSSDTTYVCVRARVRLLAAETYTFEIQLDKHLWTFGLTWHGVKGFVS